MIDDLAIFTPIIIVLCIKIVSHVNYYFAIKNL